MRTPPFLRWLNVVFVPAMAVSFAFVVALPVSAQDEAKAEAETPPTATASTADEPSADPVAGHSLHGEVFNEGPRQAAVLIPGTGKVDFPVTTKSKEAQQFFTQGVGQLHGYWDFEAERSFRQAAALDPDCAMAYWGMAAANFRNAKRGTGFIKEAEKRKAGASKREQMWIDAYARFFSTEKAGEKAGEKSEKKPDEKTRLRDLVRDLEALALEFPDDVEPKAFIASLLYYNSNNGHPISSHLSVEYLIREIHERQPDHPAHHFRIHLWDREKPERALASAAACGPAAPGIAHMWHMPGHTYSKLNRYHDAAWQQEASARVDHAHMMKYQVIPDQIHNFAHNNEWLIRNLNSLGRVEDAIDLACNMIELPRLPKFEKDTDKYSHSNGSWTYGRTRLRDTLVRYEQWDRLRFFLDSEYLKEERDVIDAVEWRRLQGLVAFETGNADQGRERIAQLEELGKALQTEKAAAISEAEAKALQESTDKDKAKNEAAVKKAGADAEKRFKDRETAHANALAELKAYDLIARGEASQEEMVKALNEAKNVEPDRKARLLLEAGALEEATKAAASSTEVYPLATRALAHWRAGKHAEAADDFEKLRVLAAHADLEMPVFQRLAPIVEACGLEGDWRLPHQPAKDLGPRPDLDELGPFRWEPGAAPDWKLANHEGRPFSLKDYRNRPVVMIFYLGSGCTHCMEQLKVFTPWQEKFAAAGIELVAVSIESPEELAETWLYSSGKEENPFPFTILGDGDLKTFKAFRAFDDFERLVLHGTYLIDGAGRIRWLNISHEPFMQPGFLLEESQRLLSFDES